MIPYGRQSIDEADIAAVVDILRSDFLTQGPTVEHFEACLSAACGAAHAVAVNSATSALHLAYLALGLGPGKRLWTSPNTFVATANAALLCGAEVDFVDIEPTTYNIDPRALEAKLEAARRSDQPLPDVVTMVDFAGQCCDVEAIRTLADRYRFRLVEDASHAIGASWHGEPAGCGRHADITVFSFHPVKVITTGEGGAALTADAGLAESMRLLRTHGVTREASLMEGDSQGPWYYEQVALGLNYRMTDFQAALGLSQMDRLADFVARRRALAAYYDTALAPLPLTLPAQDRRGLSAYHLYPITLAGDGAQRRAAFIALRARGIGVQVHYIPVHLQPFYRWRGFRPGNYPVAERYYERTISLPLFPAMTHADQDTVIAALTDVLACRNS